MSEMNIQTAETGFTGSILQTSKAGNASDAQGKSAELTLAEAGREIGSHAEVQHAVRHGVLRAREVGHNKFVSRADWEAWKATRQPPNPADVRLADLSVQLGIQADRLNEYARKGLIPGAVRRKRFLKPGSDPTKFGTWYLPRETADQLLANRATGATQPWQPGLQVEYADSVYDRWLEARHPASCEACAAIWGDAGPPKEKAEFVSRYAPLGKGAKFHLVRKWTPGLTVPALARKTGFSHVTIRRAINTGALQTINDGPKRRISDASAEACINQHSTLGAGADGWISLETAARQYHFTVSELEAHIAERTLRWRTSESRDKRELIQVRRGAVLKLRQRLGFSETHAAKLAKVTVAQLRAMLATVGERPPGAITIADLRLIIKKMRSRQGATLKEAAEELDRSVAWVKARLADGTATAIASPWAKGQLILTAANMSKLRAALVDTKGESAQGAEWLSGEKASLLAGVSKVTLGRWAEANLVMREYAGRGWRYHRASVMAQAEAYWATATPRWRSMCPGWILAKTAARGELGAERVQPNR